MHNDFFTCGTIISLNLEQYLLGWGERTWLTQLPENAHKHTPYFFFPDFFQLQEKKWFTHTHWRIADKNVFNSLPQVVSPSLNWSSLPKEDFKKSFAALTSLFETGELKKAVPYIFINSQTAMSVSQLQHSLKSVIESATQQKLHVYGFWDAQQGILGATPETLFSYQNGKLSTVACAGTQQGHNFGPKEHEEHQLVIDGICESLEAFGELNVGVTSEKNLNLFSHLFTPIQVELKIPFDFQKFVDAMHPTPALGAFPRKKGWEWLKEYQKKISRHRFGAPVGCVYENCAYCYVAIRNVQWSDAGMAIGAGCGVIAKSDVEDEWKEIQWKLRSIQQMLSL